MDESANKILFVTKGDRLIGSLTDGDIRRHLLAGGTLYAHATEAANLSPKSAVSRAEARKLLNRKGYTAIPITDEGGKLVSIAFRDEKRAREAELGLPVVIMAGGKGTRLEPYTKVLPKPLIPVGDLPIIDHIMRQFQRYGCECFHLIVNHKKQLIKAYFAESENGPHPIYYDEDKPLGTGGGLYLLKGKVNETFFLTNCDILVKADYEEILRFHREHGNSITMVCAKKDVTIPYGVVETAQDGKFLAMTEKPHFSFLTNTGFYLVEPEVLNDIEEDVPIGFPDIIEREHEKGSNTGVYIVEEDDWLDMGQLTGLEEMREKLYGRE